MVEETPTGATPASATGDGLRQRHTSPKEKQTAKELSFSKPPAPVLDRDSAPQPTITPNSLKLSTCGRFLEGTDCHGLRFACALPRNDAFVALLGNAMTDSIEKGSVDPLDQLTIGDFVDPFALESGVLPIQPALLSIKISGREEEYVYFRDVAGGSNKVLRLKEGGLYEYYDVVENLAVSLEFNSKGEEVSVVTLAFRDHKEPINIQFCFAEVEIKPLLWFNKSNNQYCGYTRKGFERVHVTEIKDPYPASGDMAKRALEASKKQGSYWVDSFHCYNLGGTCHVVRPDLEKIMHPEDLGTASTLVSTNTGVVDLGMATTADPALHYIDWKKRAWVPVPESIWVKGTWIPLLSGIMYWLSDMLSVVLLVAQGIFFILYFLLRDPTNNPGNQYTPGQSDHWNWDKGCFPPIKEVRFV